MYLARVTKIITASEKHAAYIAKRVFVVQPVLPDGSDTGSEQVAVDYIGSGIGDTVVCGGAPGVARDVFGLKQAPIRTLIMAIVEKVDFAMEKSPDHHLSGKIEQ